MSKKRRRSAGASSGTAQSQKQEAVKAAAVTEQKQEMQKEGAAAETPYSEDAYAAAEGFPEEQTAANHDASDKPEVTGTPAAEPDEAHVEKIVTTQHPEEEHTLEKRKQASRKKKAPVKQQEKADDQPEEGQKQGGLFGALIRKMIFCAALGIFCYALSGLLVLLWGYYSSQKEYRDLNKDTVVIGTTESPENSPSNQGEVVVDISGNDQTETRAPYLEISVDEEKLKALNQDYAFYVVIPGTAIQYPVVQGEDNNHYLRYTYSNQENTAGSIAIDYRTDRSTYLETFNLIMSGHNRQDGTMFSDLANYKEESFRDEHPYVYIIMDGKEYVYEFYSFYAMEPVAVCYNPNTADDVYLEFTKENNSYTNDIDVTLDDHIITMYTCNEDSSMRYLCHAVLRDVYELK